MANTFYDRGFRRDSRGMARETYGFCDHRSYIEGRSPEELSRDGNVVFAVYGVDDSIDPWPLIWNGRVDNPHEVMDRWEVRRYLRGNRRRIEVYHKGEDVTDQVLGVWRAGMVIGESF